jgi:DNA polymerase III epsilon subunit-like protein/Rad3-related DNA helicase
LLSKKAKPCKTVTMFISLDLETTGLDPLKDRIIEFGAIKFEIDKKDPEKIIEKESLQILINPGTPIPQVVTHITNIKDSDVENAPSFEEKKQEIEEFINDLPIIGHNIKFDTDFLRGNGIEIKNTEYDTFKLASILLPKLNSYSLEVISQELNLKHKEKHRALDDAIAAMELFAKLLKEFQSLPEDIGTKIKSIITKSDWPLKTLLMDVQFLANQKTPKEKTEQTSPTLLKSNYKNILEKDSPTIFEENPPYTELIKDLADRSSNTKYIALPADLFYQIEKEIPDNIAKIDLHQNYISLKRLEEFEQKDFFEETEVTALLKCLIWSQKTETGLLNELQISPQERIVINQLNINPHLCAPEEEHFYKKAIKKDETNPTICTHEYLIDKFFLISKETASNEAIILNIESFYTTFLQKLSSYTKPESLEIILKELKTILPDNKTVEALFSRATILFGLLGIIFEKHNNRDEFKSICIPNKQTTEDSEWINAKESLQNLIEISMELGEVKSPKTIQLLQDWKKILETLQSILQAPESTESLTWIEKDLDQNPVLRRIPFNIDPEINNFFEKFKNYKLIGECLDLNDEGDFIKKTYGLPPSIDFHKNIENKENLQIVIVEDAKGFDKNQLPEFIGKYLKEKQEKIAIICNSKQRIKDIALSLGEQNIPTLSQLTGSITKLNDKFKENIGLPIIITNYAWENFKYHSEIDTLFIDKIPFESPNSDYMMTKSPNFEDPFNQLQIPKAAIALKKIINKLDSTIPKKIIIFDSRILTKSYGEYLMKTLQQISKKTTTSTTKEIFTIDFFSFH